MIKPSEVIEDTQKKHIGIIHKLRGIAALMVFLFHLFFLSNNFFGSTTTFFLGKYGIHVFFVISGFVIIYSLSKAQYTLSKWHIFILKRLIRLEPPYIIVLLLTFGYLAIRAMVKGANADTPTFNQLFLHIGYLIPFVNAKWLSIVFWSLAVEFQFYLLISILYSLIIKNVVYRWGIFAIFWSLQFVIPSMEFFYWSLVFILGIQLALYKVGIIQKGEFVFSLFVLPMLIYFNYYLEVFIFSFITALLILMNKDIKSHVLDFLGDISYSLYLIHMLLYIPLFNLALKYSTGIYVKILSFTGIIFFVILSAYILYCLVEKPSQRLASSIKYGSKIKLSFK